MLVLHQSQNPLAESVHKTLSIHTSQLLWRSAWEVGTHIVQGSHIWQKPSFQTFSVPTSPLGNTFDFFTDNWFYNRTTWKNYNNHVNEHFIVVKEFLQTLILTTFQEKQRTCFQMKDFFHYKLFVPNTTLIE